MASWRKVFHILDDLASWRSTLRGVRPRGGSNSSSSRWLCWPHGGVLSYSLVEEVFPTRSRLGRVEEYALYSLVVEGFLRVDLASWRSTCVVQPRGGKFSSWQMAWPRGGIRNVVYGLVEEGCLTRVLQRCAGLVEKYARYSLVEEVR